MFGPRVTFEAGQTPVICTPYDTGVNAIFLALIPYTVVTALHDSHLVLAMILGTAFSGTIILLGLAFRIVGGYRTWPFYSEFLMLTVNAILLGVSVPERDTVVKYLPFITNSIYTAFALASILIYKPFTLQYLREFVPASASTHEKLIRAAYATTCIWVLTFLVNTLFYLIPVCTGRDDDHESAVNLAFRIILPIFFALFAALATRLWPLPLVTQLLRSNGFDGAPTKVVVNNPLAVAGGGGGGGMGLPQPMQVNAFAT